MKAVRIIFSVVSLIGLGMVAGGVVEIIHKNSGPRARATVTGCHVVSTGRNATDQCSGSWVAGGALVGGAGHVVLGPIYDANPSQIGKTIDVRLSGDHAYTGSLRVPIILLVLGLLVALGGVFLIVASGRQPSATSKSPRGKRIPDG